MPVTHGQIQKFLSEFKDATRIFLHVVPRKKNLEFLIQYGLTPQQREDMILGLQVRDYVKGPESDDRSHGPKNIWFFGIEWVKCSIYTKLELCEEKSDETGETTRHAVCIGFHEAEWPMAYPYRKFER